MKRSRFIAALMLLLACACFVSMPVFAELPWDADYGGGSGDAGSGTDNDSIVDGDDNADRMESVPGGTDFPFWWFGYSFRSSFPYLIGYVVNTQGHADHHQATTGKNTGSSTSRTSSMR